MTTVLKDQSLSVPDFQVEPYTPKPISLARSSLLFGLPALLLVFFYWIVLPVFIGLGIEPVAAFMAINIIPMSLMLVLSLALYAQERQTLLEQGKSLSFRDRFRFPPITGKDLLQALGVALVLILGYGAVMSAYSVPAQNFGVVFENISGRYDLLILYVLVLFFNITSEEFLWRGYLLPRQEQEHGRYTWIIHGIQWNLFHAFKWWDLVPLLPVTMIISFVAYRTKRNWSVAIAHTIFNGLGLILFASMVFS